ncbi:MAG: bacteriohemerythrin [Proteobacteria bacterium]|nr:bacteriohemerythrin [Pseudomonadota bacterium]MBU1716061.1 bacteriohemerythrin [Pseudomonadota bacterium]
MQNIVEFSEGLVVQTALINGYSESDWGVLCDVQSITMSWSKEFSKMFTEALYADPNTSKILAKVNSTDHQQSFAVWYETLASGKPGATFWPETCLVGLFHAAAGVDNRHVIGLFSKLEVSFHRKCLESFELDKANEVFWAFKRIMDIALAIMVDSYHFANIVGMKDVGVNEALFARIRGLSIRKMIDEARSVLPLIEWNDSLSVGLDSIDEQHKKLVDILNSLHGSSASAKDPEAVKKILNDLVEYTVYHFNYEEGLMKEHQYPDLENHLVAHKALVEQVGKFNEDFQAGRAKLSSELFKFLRSWLNGHIRGTDKRYSAHMKACGVN